MSIKVMNRVWEYSKQSGGALLVLLAMADHADDEGICWPSVPMLAAKARLSDRQVQRVMSELIEQGEVHLLEAGGGRWQRNRYQVVIGKGDILSPVTSVTTNGDIHNKETVTSMSPLPSLLNLHSEPSTPLGGMVKEKPAWIAPEWFVPLTTLPGYKQRNHGSATKMIEAVCREAGVSPQEVIKAFAAEYPALRHQYGWSDPVAVLRGKPLAITISKLKGTAEPRFRGNGIYPRITGKEQFAKDGSYGP